MADRLTELISQEKISARVAELGQQISADYRGSDLLMVGVLKGCFVFLADLVRAMDLAPAIDFLRVASYGQETETSGVVQIRKDLESSITGRDVLIVEDIIDTGLTLDYLVRYLRAREPHTLRLAALLDKPSRRRVELELDYVGFQIADEFVVGYGLDFNEKYRHLSSVYIVEPDRNA